MLNLDKLLINYMDSPSGVEREPVIEAQLRPAECDPAFI